MINGTQRAGNGRDVEQKISVAHGDLTYNTVTPTDSSL